MRTLLALGILAVAALGFAQTAVTPVKIKVRHADPWMLVALLQGQPVISPEISTLMGFMGMPAPPQTPGFGNLFPAGRVFVNPTDNSIWFVPEK